MRLVTYQDAEGQHVGVEAKNQLFAVRDLTPRELAPDDMLDLIDRWSLLQPVLTAALTEASNGAASVNRSGTKLLAPIPRPRKNIFGVGMNYVAHVDEANRSMSTSKELPKAPVYFSKPPTTVIGPDETILHHAFATEQLDWEGELGVIIGKKGKGIRVNDALNHVFGYTCINDISARDCRRENQWFLAKAQDTSAPMGPALVTADEIPDPQKLTIELKVNGETKQQDETSLMIFNVAEIIADLSKTITLEPGDIIATGTPAGVGISRTPPEFLTDGDIVELSIDSIGVLRNMVRLVKA